MNQNIFLLCDNHHGIYIPQIMTARLKAAGWSNITDEMIEHTRDPENELYWNTWCDDVLNSTFTDEKTGQVFQLHHDGDLWAYCPDSITPTEYYNLFGEYPEWYSQDIEDEENDGI